MGRLKALLSNPASQIEVQAALVTAVLEDEAAETGALDTLIGNFVPDAISSVAVEILDRADLIIADDSAARRARVWNMPKAPDRHLPGQDSRHHDLWDFRVSLRPDRGKEWIRRRRQRPVWLKAAGRLDRMMGVAGYVGKLRQHGH